MTRVVAPPRAPSRHASRRSAGKHLAILDAATRVFLRDGYLGTSMDEVAALSGVAKQTVYKHFASKEALFIEIVTSMVKQSGDAVLDEVPNPETTDAAAYLQAYASRQLTVVLQPRLMQLRRLVIGEVGRFPALAQALHAGGPQRAIAALEQAMRQLAERGLLEVDDPRLAATQFNWLIMGAPLNEVMLLGDAASPSPDALRRHVAEGVRVFLAAYGAR